MYSVSAYFKLLTGVTYLKYLSCRHLYKIKFFFSFLLSAVSIRSGDQNDAHFKDPDPHGLLWEMLLFIVVVKFLMIKSLPYTGQNRELVTEVCALLEKRYKITDKFNLIQKEFESLASTFIKARLKNKLSKKRRKKMEAINKGLETSNSFLGLKKLSEKDLVKKISNI